MMLKIEVEGRLLRSTNDAVLSFMREHRVASLWGRGLFASADMMSLEATRYLWSGPMPSGPTLMCSTSGASFMINRLS